VIHLIVLFLLIFIPVYSSPLSLSQIFEASRNNMETIKKSKTLIEQSQERKHQAIGALLPTVRFFGTETRIDSPKAGFVNRAFLLTRQYSTGIRLEQPLLRGGSIAALNLRDEEILLNKFYETFELQNLYQLVIRSYFDFIKAKNDLILLQELLYLSQKREKELKHLTSLGRSRKTELIEAEAQTLSVLGKINQVEIYLKESQEHLLFLSGLRIDEIPSLDELTFSDSNNLNVDISNRPDLRIKRQEVLIADEKVKIAKGGHYPSVDLFSNYYFDRTGVLQTSEWDLGVSVSFPLFQGGVVSSQVRESVAMKREAELKQMELDRQLQKDLRVLKNTYQELISQMKILKLAVKKYEEAYSLNLKDYRLGQTTNLEVLQSLNLYIENKRAYQQVLVDTHAQKKILESFSGELP
jgi:outer membrane protein